MFILFIFNIIIDMFTSRSTHPVSSSVWIIWYFWCIFYWFFWWGFQHTSLNILILLIAVRIVYNLYLYFIISSGYRYHLWTPSTLHILVMFALHPYDLKTLPDIVYRTNRRRRQYILYIDTDTSHFSCSFIIP